MLSVVMLSVIMLNVTYKFFVQSVVRLSVVMLSVVAQIGIPLIINTIKKTLSWFALVRVLKFETF